ncbi:Fc.00g064430.m01.CDS01 [Cosmosporella sp. VM-42]
MAASIIYLDNLSEKLTEWSPNDENHLYAIVDMGSNGIRFSVTSLAPPTTRLLRPIYSSRAPISLFDALTPRSPGSEELVFPPETITATAAALGHFHRLAVLHGVPSEHILVMATEAMRKAANATEMLNAISQATQGLGVNILNPDVETLCGAVMGSRSGLVSVDSGALFLDLGGGSVQMTWVDTSKEGYEIAAARAGRSLPFGAARLIKVLEEESQEVQIATISALQYGMHDAYRELCKQFPGLQFIKTAYEKDKKNVDGLVDVYMCGGGFRGYGSMLMHEDPINPYPISSTATYTAPGTLFKRTDRMRWVNKNYDGKIFGLSKRRRAQFPAIATVVDAFISAVPNIRQVTFCGGSNREGALMMKLPREIRESNPLNILAGVTAEEEPVFNAVLQKLSDALPKEVDFSDIPTILNSGLGPLFIHEIWIRQGYDDDANSSFALNHAATGHFDAPGLSHLARALLALTGASRWGGSFGPVDTQLAQGLAGILQAQNQDAPFWAAYIGAVAGVIAMVLPVSPKDAADIEKAITIQSRLKQSDGKKDKVILTIGVASDNTTGINLVDLADKIEGAAKKVEGKKPRIKISAKVNVLS